MWGVDLPPIVGGGLDAPGRINPFAADPVKALHFAILVQPKTIWNFWHSAALALRTERQSARMSKNKNGGLDQYGAEPFEQQQIGTAGVERVNSEMQILLLLLLVQLLHGSL